MRGNRLSVASLLIAAVAVVLALTNPSIALPGKDRVDSGDIVNGAVKGVDVAEGSLGVVPAAKALAPLPSGKSMSGVFSGGAGDAESGYFGAPAQFPRPLKKALPQENIIDTQVNPGSGLCPGPGRAAPGYMCLYYVTRQDVGAGYGYPTKIGVQLYWPISATPPSEPYASGTWTVTAP